MKTHATDHQDTDGQEVRRHPGENRPDTKVPAWSNPLPIVWCLMVGALVSLLSQLPGDEGIYEIFTLPVFLLTFGAAAALCFSPWWSRSRKVVALVWLLVPNFFLAFAIAATDSRAIQITVSCVSLVVRAGAIWWIWHNRTVPAPGRYRFPRWAKVLTWIVVVAAFAGEAVLWAVTL